MTGPVTVAYKPTEAANGAKTEAFYDAGQEPTGGRHHPLLAEGEARPARSSSSILDADGTEIRSFTTKKEQPAGGQQPTGAEEGAVQAATGEEEVSSEEEPQADDPLWVPVAPGMNRFVWDYRYPEPTKLEDAQSGRRAVGRSGKRRSRRRRSPAIIRCA